MSGELPAAFVKGHGTGNDFVIVPDYDGTLTISAQQVAAMCDRHSGIGGDGLIRVVRSSAEPSCEVSGAEWFMDYRNADGSVAEMCGNGARVFARYLVDESLVTETSFQIATRGGLCSVAQESATTFCIGMGLPVDGPSGPDPRIHAGELIAVGSAYWMPNPHAVVFVEDLADPGDLVATPRVDAGDRFPDGVNVEFVVDRSSTDAFDVAMRVFERGVGETQSCGTGACAVALAVLDRHNVTSAASVSVEVPGGLLRIDRRSDGQIFLAGPTEIVASGTIAPTWWEERS